MNVKAPTLTRNRWSVSLKGKIFLSAVLIESLVLIADRVLFDIQLAAVAESNWFFGFMVINTVFMVYFAFDAILNENHVELIGFLVASLLLTLRVSVEYSWRNSVCAANNIFGFCLSFYVLFLVFQLFYLVIGPMIRSEMGWKFFKYVGTDVNLKKMFTTYQVFVSIRKMDLQHTCLVVFTGIFWLPKELVFLIVSSVVGLLSIAYFFVGHIAFRRESPAWAVVFFVGCVISPAYILWVGWHTLQGNLVTSATMNPNNWEFAWKLLILGCLALVNRVLSIIWAIFSYRNFGKGLRDRALQKYYENIV
eukprot:TRINITY_DN20119_c0_g1_i1.p1 TRINITY_DN20119_c0_g1~~TRINITY_DN20119_c0_g1_i1.p1  ORF type:complete len:348 (-),score=45.45 TRINITY_DN20119_c0_g1_i1:42-962(-)